MELLLKILGLEDSIQMIMLERPQGLVQFLGGELLQAADGDGIAHCADLGIGRLDLPGNLGDALEDFEVGVGLKLDGLAFVLREPEDFQLGLGLGSNGADIHVEAECDEFGGRADRRRRS